MADVVRIDAPGHGKPRVTFTVFASADDPMLRAWLRFRAPLLSAAHPDPQPPPPRGGVEDAARQDRRDGGELGFWRLLASNNRELGRSFLLYRSFDQAWAHMHLLQERPEELAVAYVTGPVHGARGWIVTADDVPIMTCSRWYDSTAARAAAASGALAALPVAQMSAAPDRSGPSGRFLRRSHGRADVGQPPRRAERAG